MNVRLSRHAPSSTTSGALPPSPGASIGTFISRYVSAAAISGRARSQSTADCGRKDVIPSESFAAGVMKRSATMPRPIHASRLWRKECVITTSATYIATAAASAATVIALRRSPRVRRRAARIIAASPLLFTPPADTESFTHTREISAAPESARGAKSEPASRTKNAAPNATHAGPAVSARHEHSAATPHAARPQIHQPRARSLSRFFSTPRRSASTGTTRDASAAGPHAPKSAAPTP